MPGPGVEPPTTGMPSGRANHYTTALFLIYINDLALTSTKFFPIMYADGTTLLSTLQNFTSNHSSNSLSYNVNAELTLDNTMASSEPAFLECQKD